MQCEQPIAVRNLRCYHPFSCPPSATACQPPACPPAHSHASKQMVPQAAVPSLIRSLAVSANACWLSESTRSVHARIIYYHHAARRGGIAANSHPTSSRWQSWWRALQLDGLISPPGARSLSKSDDPHLEDGNTRRSRATGTASPILQVTPTGQ